MGDGNLHLNVSSHRLLRAAAREPQLAGQHGALSSADRTAKPAESADAVLPGLEEWVYEFVGSCSRVLPVRARHR